MLRTVELFAGGAERATAVANSTGNVKMVPFEKAIIVLDLTATSGVAGDTLDVYVDVLVGQKWINAVHFTQMAGDAAAASYAAVLTGGDLALSSDLAAPMVVTSDAAAGKVRQQIVGQGIRGRYTLVDAGAHGQGATFSLYATLWD